MLNPGVFDSQYSSAVPFETEVTINCTVPGHSPDPFFQRTQICSYDPISETYSMVGESLECGCK